jgi:hypothetical protein
VGRRQGHRWARGEAGGTQLAAGRCAPDRYITSFPDKPALEKGARQFPHKNRRSAPGKGQNGGTVSQPWAEIRATLVFGLKK